MQIVIDIPEEMYQKIKETSMVISGRRSGRTIDYTLFNAVNEGIPLPKGHGRLIDADAFNAELNNCAYDTYNDYSNTFDWIEEALTIIKADKGEEE